MSPFMKVLKGHISFTADAATGWEKNPCGFSLSEQPALMKVSFCS